MFFRLSLRFQKPAPGSEKKPQTHNDVSIVTTASPPGAFASPLMKKAIENAKGAPKR